MTKAIAFYLPQYHRIPENDQWWGNGFTEWTNVSAAEPLFDGHYQPHVPLHKNYYNLLDTGTQHWQINLAKKYDIYGFCFYFYWFNGRTLLEQPLRNWLNDKSLDFPFCLCWANENWTRRWDGLENDILIQQQYSPKDNIAFIHHVAPYLRDPRYIRINGKPLVILYRPSLLPNPSFTTAQWRYECRRAGVGEIYLAYVQSFDTFDPQSCGFDAAIEFPPVGVNVQPTTHLYRQGSSDATYNVYAYEEMARNAQARYQEALPYNLFPGVCPSWDNTARRRKDGASIINGATPEMYRQWLTAASRCAHKRSGDNPDLDLVFINAWNEWGEGCHLEPDERFGLAYLEASRDALQPDPALTTNAGSEAADLPSREPSSPESANAEPFAIVIHAFYLDVLQDLLPSIVQCRDLGIKVYITCPEQNGIEVTRILSSHSLAHQVFTFENRGRDILPFIRALPTILANKHQYIIKIHTKKTLHRSDGERWLLELTKDLIGRSAFNHIKQRFDQEPGLGIIGPSGNVVPTHFYLGSNLFHIRQLLERLDIPYESFLSTTFVTGSMLAARADALWPLNNIQLQPHEFEEEAGQVDGTLAHAIERIITVSAEKAGYRTESSDGVITHDFQYAEQTDMDSAEAASQQMASMSFNAVGTPTGLSATPHDKFTGWIDYPNEGEKLRGTTDISGWCFMAGSTIKSVRIWIGNKFIKEADYGHARNDILEVYPHAGIADVGFNAYLDLSTIPEVLIGRVGHIHLEIITDTDRFLGLTKTVVLPPARSNYLDYLLTRSTSYEMEPMRPTPVTQADLGVRTICFYLPQFHAIPENDRWWGKGFTEWVNVAQGMPLFPGHEQPRLPADLGFYDLKDPEVQLRQIAMAQHYGIEGFCYYVYWFGGERLLELPTERLLHDGRFTAPFCLCWANENWSRRWDGGDNDILMAQKYSPEDDRALITEMARYFALNNYIRVDGKPLFLVYNVELLPDPFGTTQRWRQVCMELGIGEIYLVMCHSFTGEVPQKIGFDAAVEFPPLRFPCERMEYKLDLGDPIFPGKIYDWLSLVHNHIAKDDPEDFILYPSMVLGWDNVARKGVRGHIFHGANPKTFGEWAHALSRKRLLNKPFSSRLLFINAWNEWAEGTYLEPDRRHGYGYLNALTEGLLSAQHYGAAQEAEPPA
ncbi:MAG: glycoside hydrolase family 99-like domain-containing protein [Cyanobacteriota bacterium]|nr:glycoside hydrolase family 99-like domain-containing protein [Cyanobacteriota bacterium]